jgi:hypothetical protein
MQGIHADIDRPAHFEFLPSYRYKPGDNVCLSPFCRHNSALPPTGRKRRSQRYRHHPTENHVERQAIIRAMKESALSTEPLRIICAARSTPRSSQCATAQLRVLEAADGA